jgi:hypothetical protein
VYHNRVSIWFGALLTGKWGFKSSRLSVSTGKMPFQFGVKLNRLGGLEVGILQ